MTHPWLHVIGIGDGGLSTLTPEQRARLDAAETVFGGERHLAMLGDHPARRIPWRSPFAESAADILPARGTPAVVLATGDPSWYGPVRWLRTILEADEMRVLPTPSAFSLAAARIGWPLEAVRALTVHGREVESLNPHVAPGARLLVLSEDGASPALVADLLRRRGYGPSSITVLEHLGGTRERVRSGIADGFAMEDVAALNTLAVECRAAEGTAHHAYPTGLPDDAFRHDGKMTKRVPRALALAALAPGAGELLWDIGAGSGSISVEWLRAAPQARAVAIEPIPERRAMIRENSFRLGTHGLRIVEGTAPAALADLPAPDAVFIGGGLTDGVFHAAFAALKPGGRLAAHAVTLESEMILLGLHEVHGGELLRLAVAHAEPVGPYRGWRPAMPVTHWCLRKSPA